MTKTNIPPTFQEQLQIDTWLLNSIDSFYMGELHFVNEISIDELADALLLQISLLPNQDTNEEYLLSLRYAVNLGRRFYKAQLQEI